MTDWITIDLSKTRLFESEYLEPDMENAKQDIIENIHQRYLKYGQLADQHHIARKTGAIQKDQDYEKDQNVYDQEDSFIDDEEIEKTAQAMIIPETQFDDYQVIEGSLSDFVVSKGFRTRMELLRAHKTATPDPKSKSLKKKQKRQQKSDQQIAAQNQS